jgi:hypothetical protein
MNCVMTPCMMYVLRLEEGFKGSGRPRVPTLELDLRQIYDGRLGTNNT